jgi:hypothetical protein
VVANVTDQGDTGEYLLGLVKVRQSVEDLRKLRGEALVGYMMNTTWYARADDLIGGWCVVPLDLPPSSGVFEIANFVEERAARHIAWLHNRWLSERRMSQGGNLGELFDAMAAEPYGKVTDGEGSDWPRCKADCGLEVVRPGKVQCVCDDRDEPTSTGAM